MANADLYASALRRATQPDTPTDRNERHDVPPVTEADRAGCEKWLRSLEFLCPGEDDETWEEIKTNWIGFLSATSLMPDATLAPNRKVVRLTSGGPGGEERARERTARFSGDRMQRMWIQAAFWNKFDLLEAMTERWPRVVRVAMNATDPGEGEGAFETLVAIWDLDERRRTQAVLTSLVGFLAHSYNEDTLRKMGLELDEDQAEDVMDVVQEVAQFDMMQEMGQVDLSVKDPNGWAFAGIWEAVQLLLTKALAKKRSTARNNPLLWWAAILARSAISGERDFISTGRFNKNPMPMDADIRERVGAMVYCSKIIVLDNTFHSWSGKPEWLMEIRDDLNLVDMKWINVGNGSRPEEPAEGQPDLSPAWQEMLVQVRGQMKEYLGGEKGTAMHWVRLLEEEMGSDEMGATRS